MAPSLPKRKPKHLNIVQKLGMIKKLESGRSVASICAEYGVKKQTVSDIKKAKEKLEKYANSYCLESPNAKGMDSEPRKHMKAGKSIDVDAAVVKWYVEQITMGVNVRWIELISVAKKLAKDLNVTDFKGSEGWLRRFRKRYGLFRAVVKVEAMDANPTNVELCNSKLIANEKRINAQVYDADETELCKSSLPKTNQVQKCEENIRAKKTDEKEMQVPAVKDDASMASPAQPQQQNITTFFKKQTSAASASDKSSSCENPKEPAMSLGKKLNQGPQVDTSWETSIFDDSDDTLSEFEGFLDSEVQHIPSRDSSPQPQSPSHHSAPIIQAQPTQMPSSSWAIVYNSEDHIINNSTPCSELFPQPLLSDTETPSPSVSKKDNECAKIVLKETKKHTKARKGTRTFLTLRQKLEVIQRLDRNEKQEAILEHFDISRSALYDIKRHSARIKKFFAVSEPTPELMELDQELYKWFQVKLSEGVSVSDHEVLEKAKELHEKLSIEDSCSFSAGWLYLFKLRHGVDSVNIGTSPAPAERPKRQNIKSIFMRNTSTASTSEKSSSLEDPNKSGSAADDGTSLVGSVQIKEEPIDPLYDNAENPHQNESDMQNRQPEHMLSFNSPGSTSTPTTSNASVRKVTPPEKIAATTASPMTSEGEEVREKDSLPTTQGSSVSSEEDFVKNEHDMEPLEMSETTGSDPDFTMSNTDDSDSEYAARPVSHNRSFPVAPKKKQQPLSHSSKGDKSATSLQKKRQPSLHSSKDTSAAPPKKKQKLASQSSTEETKMNGSVENLSHSKEDEFDIVGKHIASKLRKLSSSKIQIIAEKLLFDILYEASMGTLSENTRIVVGNPASK